MSISFRPGTVEDSFTVFQIFQASVMELGQRIGAMAITGGADPEVLESLWEQRRSLFEHLARTAEHFWLAENDGDAVGYARSILRDKTRELTEFFVLPGQQSAGVGRELLKRTFPPDGAEHRLIIATLDTRALARYLKTGVYARFPACYFDSPPGADLQPVETDLHIEPMTVSAATLAVLRQLDRAVIGHGRDVDHTWLLDERQGFLYFRSGEAAGYGYIGHRSGPFALLNPDDFPAVLNHAERTAKEAGEDFGVEVPLINRTAVDYLLEQGYLMDSFFEFVMSDVPFGHFENYIFTSPPLFL